MKGIECWMGMVEMHHSSMKSLKNKKNENERLDIVLKREMRLNDFKGGANFCEK